MSEKNLWKWLKKTLPEGRYSRIEAPLTAPGFPDTEIQLPFGNFKMELKYSPRVVVPFSTKKKGLHQTQLTWFKEDLAAGGNPYIVIGISSEVLFIPGICYPMVNGATLAELRDMASLILDRADPKVSVKLENFLRGDK